MPERVLIENCSPTLAGMKPANLISIAYEDAGKANDDIREMNRIFVRKGLRAVPLTYRKGHVLLYLYRPGVLSAMLSGAKVQKFLRQFGYECTDADRCVARLRMRVQKGNGSSEFPHEIGIFLGYPLEDVEGFMYHKEEGCKCIGFWRVYGDEKKARETFRSYQNCTQAYLRSWECGRSLEQLTVAAGQ